MKTICIGTIYRGGHLVRGGRLHWQKGITMTWRGNQQGEDWCQPWQFLNDAGLRSAVATRLRLAGLRLESFELQPAAFNPEVQAVMCGVSRRRCPHPRASERHAALRAAAECRNKVVDFSGPIA